MKKRILTGKHSKKKKLLILFIYILFIYIFFIYFFSSFGIVLWEILTSKSPFANHTEVKPYMKAVALEGERPKIPGNIFNILFFLLFNILFCIIYFLFIFFYFFFLFVNFFIFLFILFYFLHFIFYFFNIL